MGPFGEEMCVDHISIDMGLLPMSSERASLSRCLDIGEISANITRAGNDRPTSKHLPCSIGFIALTSTIIPKYLSAIFGAPSQIAVQVRGLQPRPLDEICRPTFPAGHGGDGLEMLTQVKPRQSKSCYQAATCTLEPSAPITLTVPKKTHHKNHVISGELRVPLYALDPGRKGKITSPRMPTIF